MEDQKQNNTNQVNAGDVAETASASPSLDSPKLELAEEYLNNWKRERADFVNYKKDEGKRMEEFVKFANEGLILELLDTMDDLYLAAKQVKDVGLEQVIKKFEDLLKKYGVEKIKVGDPAKSPDGDNGARKFDPMTQEVVTTETQKGQEDRNLEQGITSDETAETPAPEQSSVRGAAQNEPEAQKEEKIEEVRAGYTMYGRVIRPARVRITK